MEFLFEGAVRLSGIECVKETVIVRVVGGATHLWASRNIPNEFEISMKLERACTGRRGD